MRKIGFVSGPGWHGKITVSELFVVVGALLLGGVMIGESLNNHKSTL